jgi:hypothetical protein
MDIFGKCAEFTDARDHVEIELYAYFQPLYSNDGGSACHLNRDNVRCGSK